MTCRVVVTSALAIAQRLIDGLTAGVALTTGSWNMSANSKITFNVGPVVKLNRALAGQRFDDACDDDSAMTS